MLCFTLAKQTTTRNIYNNIYLFSRRTIVWSRSNQVRYWNCSSMRPGFFEVSRRWPRKRPWGNNGTSLREQWNFSQSSVQFVSLILPSNSHVEIWTHLHAPAISSYNWLSEYALLLSLKWHVWSSSIGNNCHAVHRSLSSGASLCDGTVAFLPCPILSAKLAYVISSHNWPSEYALLLSLKWHVWSSSSGNNCYAVHRSLSSGASLCDGTVAFLRCPILSAKLYFTIIIISNFKW